MADSRTYDESRSYALVQPQRLVAFRDHAVDTAVTVPNRLRNVAIHRTGLGKKEGFNSLMPCGLSNFLHFVESSSDHSGGGWSKWCKTEVDRVVLFLNLSLWLGDAGCLNRSDDHQLPSLRDISRNHPETVSSP